MLAIGIVSVVLLGGTKKMVASVSVPLAPQSGVHQIDMSTSTYAIRWWQCATTRLSHGQDHKVRDVSKHPSHNVLQKSRRKKLDHNFIQIAFLPNLLPTLKPGSLGKLSMVLSWQTPFPLGDGKHQSKLQVCTSMVADALV